jgi:DNA-binding response OmpR family regulator
MSFILVVEEDPQVCAVVRLVLEDDGHRVLCAFTMEEGRSMLRSEPRIDLLLIGLEFQGDLDAGLGLAVEARRSRAGIPVVYTTATGIGQEGARLLLPGSTCLEKPFGPRQLKDAIKIAARSQP